MLRRLEKRILVDLPTLQARQAMLQQYLPPVIHSGGGSVEIKTEIDYEKLAAVRIKQLLLSIAIGCLFLFSKIQLGIYHQCCVLIG